MTRATRDGRPIGSDIAAAPAGGQAGGPKPCTGDPKPTRANKASHLHHPSNKAAPLVPLVAVVAVSPSATAYHTRVNLQAEALWVRPVLP